MNAQGRAQGPASPASVRPSPRDSARKMPFGKLIEFLTSQPNLPNIDMKQLDEFLGVKYEQ